MQLPAKNARTDVIQRNVMLLIAAFMSCQGGVSDEAEGNRVCVSEDTKTSGKMDGQQEDANAATEYVRAVPSSAMMGSFEHYSHKNSKKAQEIPGRLILLPAD